MTHQIPAAESAILVSALLKVARQCGINTPAYRVLVRHADEIRRAAEREAAEGKNRAAGGIA